MTPDPSSRSSWMGHERDDGRVNPIAEYIEEVYPPRYGCMGSWHERPVDKGEVCPACGSSFKCRTAP